MTLEKRKTIVPRQDDFKIDILGTTYDVVFREVEEDEVLENVEAYVDYTIKRITINKSYYESANNLKDLGLFQSSCLRHEIVHAFLHESGLCGNSWGKNEETVDWIALQAPKLFDVFKEAKAL